MRFGFLAALWAVAPLVAYAEPPAQPATVEKPAALVADGLPPVPAELVSRSRPYLEYRAAGFLGWNNADGTFLISTRFGNIAQLHQVASPMASRQQISFEAEPVIGSWSPNGDVLVAQKDNGGDEFFQLYTLKDGRLNRLTAGGKSRNELNSWSLDGSLLGFSSTERNGSDSDLYVIDPRKPASKRRVAEVKGGGWAIAAIAPDNRTALAADYISIEKTDLYLLDLTTGAMKPLGDHRQKIAYSGAAFAPNGTLWVTSDEGSDVARLGRMDVRTGRFTPALLPLRWDVESFAVSKDGRTIAFVTNEAGMNKLSLLDAASGTVRPVEGLPPAGISDLEFAKSGKLGFTMTSAKSATDAYSLDPSTLAVTRWTQSETGGLDPAANVDPELISAKSFDGLEVSGYLYRPDAARFPGPRPLIVNIHGGPEGEFQPSFLGRNNYLINELGIAIFFPNVRGSSGFGKRFVSLDNGPFRREDSVKDIGVFLDVLKKDPRLDPAHMAVTGGSYGGYMCYASAEHYADTFKGALCNVAIGNFVTFLENTESYRRDLRRVEYGDERDPKQRAKLEEISPLNHIDQIKSPMFVVAGANDPRVPASEAEQIVKALRARGIPTWYLLGRNEGHGFGKKENQDYLFWATLMFWDQTLLK
jgi:dipeptidyl aminopeptidase/acylaminoacyl peptidase